MFAVKGAFNPLSSQFTGQSSLLLTAHFFSCSFQNSKLEMLLTKAISRHRPYCTHVGSAPATENNLSRVSSTCSVLGLVWKVVFKMLTTHVIPLSQVRYVYCIFYSKGDFLKLFLTSPRNCYRRASCFCLLFRTAVSAFPFLFMNFARNVGGRGRK